jgi:hypothetical protein
MTDLLAQLRTRCINYRTLSRTYDSILRTKQTEIYVIGICFIDCEQTKRLLQALSQFTRELNRFH